jgi:hypothetical protein
MPDSLDTVIVWKRTWKFFHSWIFDCFSDFYFHYKILVMLDVSSKMDLFPNEQNFDLNKSGQKFHHSLKEHHKISNIPTFRCEML